MYSFMLHLLFLVYAYIMYIFPFSNGTAHVEVEAPETSPALVSSPVQPPKPEPEAAVSPAPAAEETASVPASVGGQEPDPVASPVPEPTPPSEFNEPPTGKSKDGDFADFLGGSQCRTLNGHISITSDCMQS